METTIEVVVVQATGVPSVRPTWTAGRRKAQVAQSVFPEVANAPSAIPMCLKQELAKVDRLLQR